MDGGAGKEGGQGDRDMPPFAALRAFDALVRTGGIRKAAQNLGLHHSVVSRHLSHLEAWLGVPLLHWTGRQFTLTASGERYHARIASAVAEIGFATRELRGSAAAQPIRVWCSHGLSIQWLAARIAEFERGFPDVHVDLRPSDTPASLTRHEADVNIFMHLEHEIATGASPGLKAQVLARPVSMIAASPALARELTWVRSASDLLQAPLLHGRHTRDWNWWLTINGVQTPQELPGELCWHPHMALEATRLGRGVLLANRFFFERDIERGDIVELKVPGTSNRPFGAYLFVAREDRWSVPAIAALRRFLTERMKVMEVG